MNLPSMQLGSQFLMWLKSVKYLDVNILSGCGIIWDVDYITRKFYCANNCKYAYSSSLPEILQLRLQQLFCLPILQFINGAFISNKQQIKTLIVCWNSIFRKIFEYNRWESLSQFISQSVHQHFRLMCTTWIAILFVVDMLISCCGFLLFCVQ